MIVKWIMFACLALQGGQGKKMEEFVQAVSSGDTVKVSLMLKRAPKLAETRTESGETVVQRAAYYGQKEVLKQLLAAKPKLDMGSACAVGDLEAAKTLLRSRSGAVDELSGDGFLPLCLAAAFGHEALVKLLIENKANVNARSKALGRVAPLDSAIFGRKIKIVELLIAAGAKVNAAQDGEFTPLHGAAQNGDIDIIKLLLSKGADKKAKTEQGKTAHDLATEGKHIEAARLLKV